MRARAGEATESGKPSSRQLLHVDGVSNNSRERPVRQVALSDPCCDSCGSAERHAVSQVGADRDARWMRAARHARILAWVSLAWMALEGGVGLFAGLRADSISLTGWAVGSVIEGLASLVVIWRFTGDRVDSTSSESRASKIVGASFYLLAAYLVIESVRDVIGGHRPESTVLGIALTAVSVLFMPVLSIVKRRLGRELGSPSTAGEGGQNLMCAAQAAAVLLALAATALLGWWWLDPAAAALLAVGAAFEGQRVWQGGECC